MDDFSQIIGIILAIGFFLFSAFRKKNKENKTTLASFVEGNSTNNEVLYDDFDSAADTVLEREKTCFKTHDDEHKEHGSVREHVDKKESKLVKPIDNDKNVAKIDLKQAVIHSEILNRKYF